MYHISSQTNQLDVSDIIIEILDIQVGTSALWVQRVRTVSLLELMASLRFLLSTSNVESVAITIFITIQSFDSSLRLLVAFEVEETEAFAKKLK